MAFLFVPINTAAYAFLPRDKNNAASGLMNLARNIGGSVGISIVTTMLDRRTQEHLNDFASHLSAGSAALASRDSGRVTRHDGARRERRRRDPAGLRAGPGHGCSGRPPCSPISIASGFSGVAILAMIPMVFLMKKSKPGGGIAVH